MQLLKGLQYYPFYKIIVKIFQVCNCVHIDEAIQLPCYQNIY